MKTALLQFNKWLTGAKKSDISECLSEYARICNAIVKDYEISILNDLISFNRMVSPMSIKAFKFTDSTFFSYHIVREAHKEVYNTVKRLMKDKSGYKTPVFKPDHITLPSKIITLAKTNNCKSFGLVLDIHSYRTNSGKNHSLSIPLRSNKYFNGIKENSKMGKSIRITNTGVIFSFIDKAPIQVRVVNTVPYNKSKVNSTNRVCKLDKNTVFNLVATIQDTNRGGLNPSAYQGTLRNIKGTRDNSQHVYTHMSVAVNPVSIRVATKSKKKNKLHLEYLLN